MGFTFASRLNIILSVTGYQHYIFVSYRRGGTAEPWVRELFLPHLRGLVENHYGGGHHVFSDDQIPAGHAWSTALDLAICNSRILLPVFDTAYFESPYCRQEIAHMREREDRCGLRSKTIAGGLIVPVHISKKTFYPDEALRLQGHDFFTYKSSSLSERKGSALFEAFEKAMDDLFKDLEAAIALAPAHDPAWRQLEGGDYRSRFFR